MQYSSVVKPSQKILDEIRKKHKFALMLLYGSQITGKVHKRSDVDIAVLSKKGTKFDLLELIGDLIKTFNTDKIDVVNIAHADPLLLFAVTQKSILLSGKEDIYQKLKLKAFHKYSDYLPYLEKEQELILKKLKKYDTA